MRKQVVVVLAGIVAVATSTPAHSGFLTILERIASRPWLNARHRVRRPCPKLQSRLGRSHPQVRSLEPSSQPRLAASGPGAEFVGVESFVDDFADDKWGELLHHLSHADACRTPRTRSARSCGGRRGRQETLTS